MHSRKKTFLIFESIPKIISLKMKDFWDYYIAGFYQKNLLLLFFIAITVVSPILAHQKFR